MAHKRRLFGSIERRPGGYRARHVGVDGRRYDAPHLFLTRIDAEGWLSEVHREVLQGTWRPPQRDTGQGSELEFLSGFARRCIAERDLTPRTREEYEKLLENLILPTLGDVQLRFLEPDRSGAGTPPSSRTTRRRNASTPTRSSARSCARRRKRGSSNETPAGSATSVASAARATSSPPRRSN